MLKKNEERPKPLTFLLKFEKNNMDERNNPVWLVLPVFRVVYAFGGRSENSNILTVQAHSDVVGKLTAHAQNSALWRFLFMKQ